MIDELESLFAFKHCQPAIPRLRMLFDSRIFCLFEVLCFFFFALSMLFNTVCGRVDITTESLIQNVAGPAIVVPTANAYQPLVFDRLQVLGLSDVVVVNALPGLSALACKSNGYRTVYVEPTNALTTLVDNIKSNKSICVDFFGKKQVFFL